MKTFEDLIKDLDSLEKELIAELPNIAAAYANDALTLAINRIEKEGAKEGAKYSQEPIYVTSGVFNQKAAFKPIGKGEKKAQKTTIYDVKTQKGKKVPVKKDFTERKTMYLPGGYKELRQIQGLPTNIVNLEYSGRMLQNTKILKTERAGEAKIIVTVGATNREEKDKLSGQHKRYGDFLGITQDIARVINEGPKKRVNELIKKHLSLE